MPGVTVRTAQLGEPLPTMRADAALAPATAAVEDGRLRVVVPVKAASEVNGRDWKARSRRTDAAWLAVSRTLGPHLALLAPFATAYHAGKALCIVLIRLGGRKLDQSNLPTTVKATEDALAFTLGACRGDQR